MKLLRISLLGSALIAALSLGASYLCAQEEPPAKPAARSYPPLINTTDPDQDSSANTDALQPDTRPLTGIQDSSLGTQTFRHSFWIPGFEYVGQAQNRNLNGGSSNFWNANNYLLANLSLLDTWAHSQFSLNYSGGGFVSTDSSVGGGNFQELTAMHLSEWGRWQVLFFDQFSYLPEASFGFGGGTNLGTPGVSGALTPTIPPLASFVSPQQNIFGSQGPRYTDSFAAQATYALSRRTSLTASGSYGILNFVDVGNYGLSNFLGNVGLDYQLTRNDTIGAFYRFTAYHYSSNPQAIGDHDFSIAYGRKITGRLALQLSGGPEYVIFRVPISNEDHRLLAGASAALTYGFERGNLVLSYSYGASGGSGVLVGAIGDQISLSASHKFGRVWSGLGSFGFARNANLATLGLSNSQQSFNSWFVTAGMSRPLGPQANLSFGYSGRFQSSSPGTCLSGVCGQSFNQHQISLGFQWNTRPFVIH
jgi:hypothetical protein